MLKVYAYLGDRIVLDQRLEHAPSVSDTVRLDSKDGELHHARVSKIIWYWNENSADGQSVNIHLDEAPAGTIGYLRRHPKKFENDDNFLFVRKDGTPYYYRKTLYYQFEQLHSKPKFHCSAQASTDANCTFAGILTPLGCCPLEYRVARPLSSLGTHRKCSTESMRALFASSPARRISTT